MRSVMKKAWFRAMLLVIFCLSLAVGLVSMTLFSFGLEDGWFAQDYVQSDEFGFEDSLLCRRYIDDCVNSVYNNLMWLEDPTSETLGGYGGPAFSYTIEGPDPQTGIYETMADTTSEKSHILWSSRIDVYVNDVLYGITGYVNLPVQPYDGCYKEFYLFNQLYPMRGYFLPVCIVSMALAIASLIISVIAAVQEGKRGSATLLGCIPFDAAVVGLFILANWAGSLVYRLPYTVLDETLFLFNVFSLYRPLRRYCAIVAVVVGALVLANQLACRNLWKNLLLRRAIKHLPPIWLAAALLVVHVVMIALCWLDGTYLTMLFLFDLALVPCIIRWWIESRQIQSASNALAAGDLNYKVDTRRLHLIWKDLGRDLNSIGDGMALAVEERMRSERMKTELITNVSHDLKTPLTSIINYIAFLKDETLPEETKREYIEVLDRQGAKLKKLTEDVVEASKAVSGAVKVNAEVFDVRELLEQSVGEYSERLSDRNIQPVIHMPEQECCILADARLLGRVLDNFITNILKYALPGTRAYFDLAADGENVVIAVKNTSRAPLDMPVEELMERFVRGDSSRSTEGSGLGLSIARSLTELMGGQFELILDGDLFKAEVSFPRVEAPITEELRQLTESTT